MPSRSMQIVTNRRISSIFSSFLRLTNIPWYIYIPSLFLHLLMDTGCFHVFVIVNNATLNMETQISFWNSDCLFFGKIPKSGIAGSYGSSIFNFWGSSMLFSTVAITVYSPINSAQASFLSTSWPPFAIFFIKATVTDMRMTSIELLIFSGQFFSCLLMSQW